MKDLLRLLRSMRFAVAILTVVAMAASIGSVLEQGKPASLYISEYGEFWAELLSLAGLTDIYHAWWFFVLLGFMASSTALCLIQNTPSMLREMRAFRQHKGLDGLRRTPHCREFTLDAGDGAGHAALLAALGSYLQTKRFSFRTRALNGGGQLFAARAGGLRRLGYLLVHGAIVMICVGGLIDGNVMLRLQLWSGLLQTETRDLPLDEVPQHSRLAADSGSFRATMNLVEGSTGSSALLFFNTGYLLQELPFSIRMKRFRVEHYDNGRPRDFASDIDIIDGNKVQAATLQVNHPFTYRGITLYQSGFGDGGTKVDMKLHWLDRPSESVHFHGTVGAASALLLNGEPYSVEFTDFRAMNVFAKFASSHGAGWFSQRGVRANMEDVGASLSFLLRDKLGQASEWNVYRNPITIDNASYAVIGRRDATENALKYVRFPRDAAGTLDSYRKLSASLGQTSAIAKAADQVSASAKNAELALPLQKTVATLLEIFSTKGWRGVVDMVPANLPKNEQAKAARIYGELLQRAAAAMIGGPAAQNDRFLHDALNAFDDARDARIAIYFEPVSIGQVNSSVLQVTHAPGARVVYGGTALLALGVCAMYFIRERRLWLWVSPAQHGTLLIAYSANRSSPLLDEEFEAHIKGIENIFIAQRYGLTRLSTGKANPSFSPGESQGNPHASS
ncbi:cytochrome c biogenesis protein ResB [Noviherbaspirillum sp.]|jgi:cytochrome c biogenesis protein|uniref:cytochrome c biogenesis protein ResB n=1 Tax=Noviherbaspirillum sp. TaxID=1926288 RepID=UPI0025F80A7C|nr:cytochrome c biogenesis protein ResB [Noviherbaspirillum sp.]